MSSDILGPLMILILISLVMTGAEVGIALAIIALIFGYITWGAQLVSMMPDKIFSLMTNFAFVAVTLFIFMGVLLERSGVARKMYEAIHILMGPLRGSLLLNTVILTTLFAACTGISGAAAVTIGLIALPSMISHGYDKKIASGTICAGAGLGVIIPPSIMLIIYGPMANVSIAKLFFAALMPGLILAGFFAAYVLLACYFKPELAPVLPKGERAIPLRQKLHMLLTSLLPTLFLIIAVLGSILFGITSPTEAAAVGALGSMILCAVYGQLNWKMFKEALKSTIVTSAMIMFIAISAGMFTSVFLAMGGGSAIENFILSIPSGFLVIFFMLSLVLVLGAVMDWIGILFILVPIFNPIVTKLNLDPLWFGILFCITLQISYVTPPFSYSVFYVKGIAPPEVSLADIYKGVIPFIGIQVAALMLFYIFPAISLWFPSLIQK